MTRQTIPSSDAPATFGQFIRARRTALGLTQAALAAQVGCSAEMLRKFEADAKRPTLVVVEHLADFFALTGSERSRFLALGRGTRATAAPALLFPRTKLQPPRLRDDVLVRSRLVAPLRAALQHARLVLVTASAGAGKTTLLAGALTELPCTSAWISLDADDNDPARFLTVLLAAFDQLAPGIAATVGATLTQITATQQPDRTAQVRLAVITLINALLELLPGPSILVLDDLHVISEPLVYSTLEYLINQLPPTLMLVIATRHDPPLPLARLRVRRELLEMRLSDLRFTADETTALLVDRLGLTLEPGEVTALHQRTEGWAAGLSLLAASLTPLALPQERSRVLADLLQSDRYIFDYLAEEVLDRQDAQTRTFLLETAVLHELTPAACQAMTGREDAYATLDALYRRNLFLIALSSQPDTGKTAPQGADSLTRSQTAYRYHDLFRAFLLERLQRETPEKVRILHERAASCVSDPLSAIEYLLQAELWDRAADSIMTIGERLLSTGAHRTVQHLIALLPEAALTSRPRLRYILGLCAWARWEASAAAPLFAAAAADFARAGDAISQGAALVGLATALSRTGDLAQARDIATQALLLPLAPAHRVQLLANRAWQDLVSGSWPQSVADLDEALAIVERTGDNRTVFSFEVAISGMLLGLPGGVGRIARLNRLVDTYVAPDQRMLHAAALTMRGWAATWLDHWSEAEAACQQALGVLGSTDICTSPGVEICLQQSVRAALAGNHAIAGNNFTHMLAALEPHGELGRTWRISLLHALARMHWLAGHYDDLRATHKRMSAVVHERIWPTDMALHREIGALVLLAERQTEAAINDLRAVADDQARLACSSTFGDPRLHLAYAYLQADRPDQARSASSPALAAIRREEAPGRLRWQGATIVAPLLRLHEANGPHAAVAAELLAQLNRAVEQDR